MSPGIRGPWTGPRAEEQAGMTSGQRWVLALSSPGALIVLLDMLVVTTALAVMRSHFGPRWASWSGRSTLAPSATPCS